MKRKRLVAAAGLLLFGLGVLLRGVQLLGPLAWAGGGDERCYPFLGGRGLHNPEACGYGQLAVRFGDPRQKLSRITAVEGEEIEVGVVLEFPEDCALSSWSLEVVYRGFELLEAHTHEAVLALGPSFEETPRASGPGWFESEVRFDADIISRLPRGTTVLPLVSARVRVSFDEQSCPLLCPEIIRANWRGSAPRVGGLAIVAGNASTAFVVPGDPVFGLRSLPGLLSAPSGNVPEPAGLAVAEANCRETDVDYCDSPRILVGALGVSAVRSLGCGGLVFRDSITSFLDPASLAYDSLAEFSHDEPVLIVAARHAVTLEGVIALGGIGTALFPEATETLERPGALHIHDSRLYFADIPRRRVFVATGPETFEALVELPVSPHSLAVSGSRLYIGDETEGAVRVFDLESGILDDEPLLSGLGPMVSLVRGPGDEFWGTSLYMVPTAGEYEGKLISFDEGSAPRILASGFEGRVDLTFSRDYYYYVSEFGLFAAEFERDRVTILEARSHPDRVILAAAAEGLARVFKGASQAVVSGVSFSALAFDAEGTLWGVGAPPGSPDQTLYRIERPLGVPRLVEVRGLADVQGSLGAVTAIEWIEGALYAVEEGAGGESFLVTVDPETGRRTPVGESGATGIFQIGGLAFASPSRTLYALSEADASLYTIGWEPGDGEDPNALFFGATGLAGVTATGLGFEESTGILMASGRAPSGATTVWALDTRTGEAGLPIEVAGSSTGEAAGAIAVSRAPPSKQLLSSSDPVTALAVSGTLSEELSALNAGPPPHDPETWQPVVRKSIDRGGSFLCAEAADPLEFPFLEAREYLREADEVTLDNCDSAFYRFTFELPPVFESACISGVANTDDQAVVFLNGERISAAMRDPGCEPNAGEPSDPCYALQESGGDSMDFQGRRALTAPTQDPFATCDTDRFLPGENELVFAVAGNAAARDPTGLEFTATVAVDRPARPELVVTHISAPPVVGPGDRFEVRWEVTNAGFETAVGPWIDRVYLSRGRQIGDDTLLGEKTFEAAAALAPLESVERRAEFTAPLAAGENWLLVITDAEGAVEEWTEERNAVFDDRPLNLRSADLVVTGVRVPEGGEALLAGTTAEISFTVVNAGTVPTAPAFWTDEVRLVMEPESCTPRPVIREGHTEFYRTNLCSGFVSRAENERVLQPGGDGYTLTVSLPLPDNVAATYFALVSTDAAGRVPETNEGNNFLFSEPFETVIADVQPDLVAEDILFPAEVFSGTRLSVSWTDRNQGSGQTDLNTQWESRWLDRVYLSPSSDASISDASIDPRDTWLGDVERSGLPLRPGEAERLALDAELHAFLEGTFYVKVKTDAADSVSEFGFEDNNIAVSESPLTVVLHPPVDLVPVSLTVEGEISPGYQVTIGWEVENLGAEPLPDPSGYTHWDTVTLEGCCLLLSHRVAEPPPYSVSGLSVVIPEGVPDGPARLRLSVDSSRSIPEGSEANNSMRRDVVVESRFADLVLRVLEPLPATVLEAGATVDLRWRVTNSGSGGTSVPLWDDEVFIRPLGDEGRGHSLGVFKSPEFNGGQSGPLLAGESYERREPVTFNWPPLQSNPGPYDLIVVTDSGSLVREEPVHRKSNRVSRTLRVLPTRSDVMVTGLTWRVTSTSPPVLEVQWTEQNVSPFPSGGWSSFLYPSDDHVLGVLDYPLPEVWTVSGLDPGEAVTHTVSISLFDVMFALGLDDVWGGFYLIATSDRLDANVANNTLAQPVFLEECPELFYVTDVEVQGDVIAGQRVSVTWTVTTDREVSHAPSEMIFLSGDDVCDPDNSVNFTLLGRGLSAGRVQNDQGWTNSGEFPLPRGVTGSRCIFVYVDCGDIARPGSVRVEISSPPFWDLEISDVLAAPAGVLGKPAEVEWRTWNRGPQVGRGSWLDSLYLSKDARSDLGDRFIGRFGSRLESPLEPGASEVFRAAPILSGVNPGDYHVVVRADVYGQVWDDDETNNVAASIGTIAISAPRLELGMPLETTLVDGEELYFEVPGVPAGKTLRVTLDHASPVMLNELYARHGEVASAGRFDHRFGAPGEPDQTVTVPATREGSYFLLAKGRGLTTTPEAERVTFLAELLPFEIEAASPERIGDRGRVTLTVEGSRFTEHGEVTLEDGVGSSWVSHHVEFVNATRLRATFLLDGLPHGALDIVVTGRAGEAARLAGGVTVEAVQGPIVEVAAPDPAAVRPGRAAGTLTLTVANRGNVDADYVFLLNTIESSEGREVVATSASTPFRGGAVTGEFLRTRAMLRALAPGETGYLTTLWRPGEVAGGDIAVGNTVASLRVEEFIESQTKIAEAARESVLANPESILPGDRERLLERAADRESWLELWLGGLVAAGAVLAEDLELTGEPRNAPGEVRSRGRVDDSQGFPAFCDALGGQLCEAWLSHGLELGVGALGSFQSAPEVEPPACSSADFLFSTFCSRWRVGRSTDPNEKAGSDGVGDERFVPGSKPIRYRVNFENVASASAPTAVVRITDPIDRRLKLSSFRLERIAFGDTVIEMPPESITFQKRLDLTTSRGVFLDVVAGVDPTAGEAFWSFRSIDPLTGDVPVDAQMGFLPPNDDGGRGEGWVEYSLRPSLFATSGPVRNEATITFDAIAARKTNTVVRTLDVDPPESRIDSLEVLDGSTVELRWSGEDPAGGSGLFSYSIYVSEDHGPFTALLAATKATSEAFPVVPGRHYAFYSLAADWAGNVEEPPEEADTFFPTRRFSRGNCNSDGRVDISDAIFHLGWNFLGTEPPACLAACDANGDGRASGEVSDAVYLLGFLFLGGAPPPAPFPECGVSPRPGDVELGCEETPACP